MSRARKLLAFGGTFSVALGIGFVMQNGDALAARFNSDGAARTADAGPATNGEERVQLARATMVDGLPDSLNQATSTTAVAEAGDVPFVVIPSPNQTPSRSGAPVQLAALESDLPVGGNTEGAIGMPTDSIAAGAADCLPSMSGVAAPAATAELTLRAPCHPNAAATIHHQGMMFTILTDESGEARVSVPALVASAMFIADMGDNQGAATLVQIGDMAGYDRSVLQWQGAEGLQIHALEFGADYGSDGHVWASAPRDPSVAVAGEGGYLVSLGEISAPEPMRAEVYTYPSGQGHRDGAVTLSVEAEVLPGNCGREISAQSIQISPDRPPFALDLTMTVPACEAVGEFLVLSNMLQDLTLASK